ncbi:MAG TPA: TIGR03960 family B12-binding radical SAM protein, partial [Spirochaetota bacterium]|nr:TIGR03960 family B12-binding radical SAM protein [Spirochaetota bacterium]
MQKIIESSLINFQRPGRYIGSESGIPNKDFKNSFIKFALCYPDVYEVGMSNNGIKIIYDIINKIDFASCERVFSPWIDFEQFLREKKIPLYSLESYTSIKEFDFLGFTLQYELLFTNILNVLSLSDITLLREERKENEPIIIAGGPVTVNPAPFSPFIDLFFIGEAEEMIAHFLNKYKQLKEQKTKRELIIKELSMLDGFYSPKYSKGAKRQVYAGFNDDKGPEIYLSPVIDIVQNKVVVEIMRGCPNKCRFCQAGVIYKPYREKNLDVIFTNIKNGLKSLGTTEVTLSSLSSGDYSKIFELTDLFNYYYKKKNVSFSLPSVKVESFDCDLLEKISSVRKSGLTFAVESGSIEGQTSLNKPVLLDKVRSIVEYASKHGWNLIKFYFMIGLPHIQNEKESIIDFIEGILKIDKKLNLNINIATFVPKPHTPYQNERQLTLEESINTLQEIHNHFKRSRARIKYHNPYTSFIEGIIARGDENVGLSVLDVFKNGGRFDGWDECFNFELYKSSFEKFGVTHEKYLEKKSIDDKLIWENIDVGLSKEYLKTENQKSVDLILTPNCKEQCEPDCSICGEKVKSVEAVKDEKIIFDNDDKVENREKKLTRYLLEFSKLNLLKFIGHIDTIKYFERLFFITDISIFFTEGFNPHPKMQFSNPLPLGIESSCELLEFFTNYDYDEKYLLETLKFYENPNLPINRIKKINYDKKISITNEIYSSIYEVTFDKSEYKNVENRFNNFNNTNIKYD